MQVTLNGQPREVPEGLTLEKLLAHLQVRGERIAIERNREIIKRELWAATRVAPGDELEIVHFVGGG